MSTDNKVVKSKSFPSILVIVIFVAVAITTFFLEMPWWVPVLSIAVGISMSVILSAKSDVASQSSLNFNVSSLIGNIFGLTIFGIIIFGIVITLIALFPKKVEFMTYIPMWDKEANTPQKMCGTLQSGTYQLDCSGILRHTANLGTRDEFTIACTGGVYAKRSDVEFTKNTLLQMPFPGQSRVGQVYAIVNDKIYHLDEKFIIDTDEELVCINANLPQTKAFYDRTKGSFNIVVHKSRLDWLPSW